MNKDVNDKIAEALNKYDYSFAIWIDKADFIIDKKVDNNWLDNLLEIRCFDKKGEFHAVRSTVDSEFSCREITDDKSYADGNYDEAQYLDIDTKRTYAERKEKIIETNCVYTTGGGMYHLPNNVNIQENVKDEILVLVRIYYKYDEDGIAHKYDWRLVEFTDAETVGKSEEKKEAN